MIRKMERNFMIQLPNSFFGKNITVEVEVDDFDNVLSLSDSIPTFLENRKKLSNRIFITFSSMFSSISKYSWINYHEVIIKVPVTYNNSTYIFPLKTYVDDSHSYARGIYLGFYKEKVSNDSLIFNFNNIETKIHHELDCQINFLEDINYSPLNIEKKLLFENSFILEQQFQKSNTDKKLMSLKTTNNKTLIKNKLSKPQGFIKLNQTDYEPINLCSTINQFDLIDNADIE